MGGAPDFERIVFGMLPRVFTSQTPRKHLESYTQTHVKEEVQAEALTRNIGGFARFLEVAALSGRLAYPPTTEEQGFLFETYLLAELRAYLSFNKGFARLSEEIPKLTCVGVYAGDRPQRTEHGAIYPYAEFLRRVWDGTLIR